MHQKENIAMPKDYSAYSADLMKSLIAKLYATVTGADENVKIPRNKFVTWLLPGVPFMPEDFLCCAEGLSAADEQQKRERYHQAFVLSRLFDFVQDISSKVLDASMQQSLFTTTQDTISSVYGDVLKYSRVVHKELSEEEKEKLQRFRNLLSVTKEVEDIITGEKRIVTEPGPLAIAYNTYMNNYLNEVNAYVNFLISAKADEIALKANYMRKRMEAAYSTWVERGYKNEYEQMAAYINRLSSMNMILYKQDMIKKYKSGRLTSPIDSAGDFYHEEDLSDKVKSGLPPRPVGGAGDFYYTTLIPGNFVTSQGWTGFTFGKGDYESYYDEESSQWTWSDGPNLGFFSIGEAAGGSKAEIAADQRCTNLFAELEFVQVPICRPWFEPGFFSMRGWTLDKLWNLHFGDKQVSDGAEKPVGRLVAYPVTALFVRNVRFTFDEADSQMQYMNSQAQAGGRVGWGPFSLGGSYSRGQEKGEQKVHWDGGTVEIEGMQLIGLVNSIIPKSPNPDPELKPEDFVTGDD